MTHHPRPPSRRPKLRRTPWPYASEPLLESADPDLTDPLVHASKRWPWLRQCLPTLTDLAMAQARTERIEGEEAIRDRVLGLLIDDRARDLIPSIARSPVHDRNGATLRTALVMAHEFPDPDDTNPNKREAKRIRGFHAIDQLLLLHNRGGMVTARHLKAVERLRRDYELGYLGGVPGRGEMIRTGSSGENSATYATWTRLHRMKAVRDALGGVGYRGAEVLLELVIYPPDPTHPRTVEAFASKRRLNRQVAMGMLVAALDRLVDHYSPRDVGELLAAVGAG